MADHPAIRNRSADLDRRFDLVVVGAGITGVQIAREAALRGQTVLLVDKGDLGSGTSSATTKYLHGGIRYLEQYQVGVVRESLRERRRAALSAPHLVRQTRFLLPVWAWSKPGRFLLGAGAAAYDALAFDRNRDAPASLRIGHPRWLGATAVKRAVPWLDPVELRGAVSVTDTLSLHPERLLLEFVLDAVSAGVVVRTHTRVTGFRLSTGGSGARVVGVELTNALAAAPTTSLIAADTVVNAAGPWMAEVLEGLTAQVGHRVGPQVAPSKGVHVLTQPVTGPWTSGVTDAVMARARNGRHVVVSPWQGREFIGPTDTPVAAPPDAVSAGADDVDEILAIANSCRAEPAHLQRSDVDDVTVGIRPLVGDPGSDTYTASRRHEIIDHTADGVPGLWSVTGGKWTTARGIAQDVVNRVGGCASPSTTSRRSVPGASGWGADPAEVFDLAARTRPEVSLAPSVREHLGRLYGVRCVELIEMVAEQPELGRVISNRPGCLDIAAQVVLAVRDEGALRLDDIIDRRLVLGTLGRVTSEELASVAAIAAPELGWDDDGRDEAEVEFERREARRRVWS